MSYTYAQRRRTAAAKTNAPPEAAPQRLSELQSGAVKPSAAEMGRRVDLPEAMRARMESSFGADLSAVKLYESKAVADAGAEAVTQGSNIAFAPGKLDFSSFGGQALLGHELSHVVSQQRGEVTGGGFLNDHALEARADREGAMAARGESVYGGATAPLSSATAAPAAGPMQAKRDTPEEKQQKQLNANVDRMFAIQSGIAGGADVSAKDKEWYASMTNDRSQQKALLMNIMGRNQNATLQYGQDYEKAGGKNMDERQALQMTLGHSATNDRGIYQSMLHHIGGELSGGAAEFSKIASEFNAQQSPETLAAEKKAHEAFETSTGSNYAVSPFGEVDFDDAKRYNDLHNRSVYNADRRKRKKWYQFGK